MNRQKQIRLPFDTLTPFMFKVGDSTDPDQRTTITNQELADRIGVAARTILRWRNDGVPLSYFYEICKVLEIRPDVREVMHHDTSDRQRAILNDPILGPVVEDLVVDALDEALTTGDVTCIPFHSKRLTRERAGV